MADVKPLKLADHGGGAGRLEEFGAGDRVPSNAVPETLQALADASWAANQVPYFTGASTVDKFEVSATSRGIIAAGLGNAANATRTTSATDTTVGRVWTQTTNGMFGLGNTATLPVVADFNTSALSSSLMRFGPSSANGPGLGGTGTTMSILGASSDTGYMSFLAISYTSDRFSIGRKNGTASPVWSELWHTSNLTPNVLTSYTLATLPNAAANPRLQAWCSNLTGGAMPVYSDGTNWRRTFDNSIAN